MRVRGGVSPREWEYHFVSPEIPGYEKTEKTTSHKHQSDKQERFAELVQGLLPRQDPTSTAIAWLPGGSILTL